MDGKGITTFQFKWMHPRMLCRAMTGLWVRASPAIFRLLGSNLQFHSLIDSGGLQVPVPRRPSLATERAPPLHPRMVCGVCGL